LVTWLTITTVNTPLSIVAMMPATHLPNARDVDSTGPGEPGEPASRFTSLG